MQLFQRVILIGGFALVGLNACNGGGSSLPAGQQCPLNYDPVPMTASNIERKSLKPEDKVLLPNSHYAYEGATLYYAGPGNPSTNLRVLVSDVKQTDGSFKAVVSCVRNTKPGMEDFTIQTQGVETMDLDNSYQATVNLRTYGFSISNTLFKPEIADGQQKVAQSPTQVFADPTTIKGADTFLIEHTDASWEVRSTAPTADGGVYFLSVRYSRTEPAQP